MLNQIFRYTKLNIFSIWNRHPFYRQENKMAPLFILSAGRSGSTLLRSILIRSQLVSIPPETHRFIPNLTFLYLKYNHLPWETLIELIIQEIKSIHAFNYWNIKLTHHDINFLKTDLQDKSLHGIIRYFYESYAQKNQPHYILWGDKTPLLIYHTDVLEKIFPYAKYIFITRDSRDVVSSYLKNGIYTDINYLCKRWIKSIKVRDFFSKKLGPHYVHLVQYEKLVLNPEEEIKKLCTFLNIPFHSDYLNNTPVYLGDEEHLHFQSTKEVIHPHKIGSWKQYLSTIQKNEILKKTSSLLKSNGYI